MLTKEELPACPVATTVQMIGSKWKLLIMRNLLARPWRVNELKKDLEVEKLGSRWDHYPYRLSRSTAEGGIRSVRLGRIHAPDHGCNGNLGYGI